MKKFLVFGVCLVMAVAVLYAQEPRPFLGGILIGGNADIKLGSLRPTRQQEQPARQQEEVGLGQGLNLFGFPVGQGCTSNGIHNAQCLRPPTLPTAPSQTATDIVPFLPSTKV